LGEIERDDAVFFLRKLSDFEDRVNEVVDAQLAHALVSHCVADQATARAVLREGIASAFSGCPLVCIFTAVLHHEDGLLHALSCAVSNFLRLPDLDLARLQKELAVLQSLVHRDAGVQRELRE
jgi:hypothetical protein